MPTNERDTRRVRTYAYDLSIGDVIISAGGDYEGTVDSVPQTAASGRVYFDLHTDQGTVSRRWADTRLVRIEIPRRQS